MKSSKIKKLGVSVILQDGVNRRWLPGKRQTVWGKQNKIVRSHFVLDLSICIITISIAYLSHLNIV